MAKTTVSQHQRTTENGKTVPVTEHDRSYTLADFDEDKRSPVEQIRRNRVRAQARQRRAAAMQQGREAAKRGAVTLRKRGKQSLRLAKSGGTRLRRAARYGSRRRRLMAAGCVLGGAAELGAGLAWSTTGVVVTGLSIAVAAVSGGLLLGGKRRG